MDDPVSRPRTRQDIWLVSLELVILASLFVADAYHHILLSKTPYLFLLGWASLRWRGMRWKDVGFRRPSSWRAALLVGLLAGLFIEAFELFISHPLLARWLGKMPDLSNFTASHGNLKMTLIYLSLIWILAAFGEELVYRGYLMNRMAGLFGRTWGSVGGEPCGNRHRFRLFPHRSGSHWHVGEYLGWAAARRAVSSMRAESDCGNCRA